jgi:pimeloyl-ACP methyl ester carboxylesterase
VLIDAHDGTAGWAAQMAATLGLRGEARDAKIAASFQAWLGRHSERKRTRLADHARALVEGTTLVADLEASPPLALTQLATIAAPALLLYGEHSDVRDRGAALAAALPRATLEIVAGCTHSILWEATALVRDRVVAWLEAR